MTWTAHGLCRRGWVSMNDQSGMPVFTGAELALADTVILLMKVMSMHSIIDSAAIQTVFTDLENRYRGQNLHTASAMAAYLRKHTAGTDRETLVRTYDSGHESPGGSPRTTVL